jgi:hypothetical protein
VGGVDGAENRVWIEENAQKEEIFDTEINNPQVLIEIIYFNLDKIKVFCIISSEIR